MQNIRKAETEKETTWNTIKTKLDQDHGKMLFFEARVENNVFEQTILLTCILKNLPYNTSDPKPHTEKHKTCDL